MIKLDKMAREALMVAIREELNGTHVNIYADDWRKETAKWEVNWAAIGSVDAEEAKEMAKNLNKAAGIVDFLNRMEIEFTYDENPRFEEMLNEGKADLARAHFERMTKGFRVAITTEYEEWFYMQAQA